MSMHTQTTMQAIRGCRKEDRLAFDRIMRVDELGMYASLSWSADAIIQRIREIHDGKIAVSWSFKGGKFHSVICNVQFLKEDIWEDVGNFCDDNPVAAFIHSCEQLESKLRSIGKPS